MTGWVVAFVVAVIAVFLYVKVWGLKNALKAECSKNTPVDTGNTARKDETETEAK